MEEAPSKASRYATTPAALRDRTPADERARRKKQANRGEKKDARRYGGKKQPASGSTIAGKGDFVVGNVLFDNKGTELLSFRVEQKDLAKLCDDAQAEGNRIPAMKLTFDKPIEALRYRPKTWVLLPEDALEDLIQDQAERRRTRSG